MTEESALAQKTTVVTEEELKRAFELNQPIDANSHYMKVYNSNPINIFARLSQKVLNSMKKENKGQLPVLSLENKKLRLKYSVKTNLADLVTLDGRSAQFLWYLIAKYAQLLKNLSNNGDDTIKAEQCTIIVFRQSEVARLFNISRQRTRDIVWSSYLTLKTLEWSFTEELPSIGECYWSFSPVSSFVETKKYGYTGIRLNVDFVRYLSHTYVKYFPTAVLQIQPKNYPNALSYAIKLITNYNINDRKNSTQRNTISVERLLNSAAYIPKKEAVLKGKSRLNQRIVQPFIRDMNHLKDLNIIADWYFKWGNSSVLIKPDKKISYEDFIKMYVYYSVPENSDGNIPLTNIT